MKKGRDFPGPHVCGPRLAGGWLFDPSNSNLLHRTLRTLLRPG
jgi:hypothetical protein